MSYIHDALKKAQRDRDGHYHKYSKALLARPEDRGTFRSRMIWWGGISILLLVMGFGLYHGFHGRPNPVTHVEIPEEAAEPTRPSQAKPTSSTKDLLEEAKRLHGAGRMDMARPLYLEVLEKDPGYVDALNNLGVLWIHEKNYREAKKSFYKAILLDARYVDPHYNLACVYALEGDTEQSIAHLKKAIALDPSVTQWAAADADLENLRQLPQFRELLDKTKTSTSGP